MRFADRIAFSLADLRYNYPHEPVPPGKTADGHLHHLTWEGAARRYPNGIPPKIRATLEGGKALKGNFTMSTAVIKFIGQMAAHEEHTFNKVEPKIKGAKKKPKKEEEKKEEDK